MTGVAAMNSGQTCERCGIVGIDASWGNAEIVASNGRERVRFGNRGHDMAIPIWRHESDYQFYLALSWRCQSDQRQ